MKKYILVLILIFVFTENVFAGSPVKYAEEAHNIVRQTQKLLSDKGYCKIESKIILDYYKLDYGYSKNLKNCSDYIYFNGRNDGATILVFEIESISIINRIIKFTSDEYFKNNQNIYFKVKFFKTGRFNTNWTIFFGDKPFKTVEFLHKDTLLYKIYKFLGKGGVK